MKSVFKGSGLNKDMLESSSKKLDAVGSGVETWSHLLNLGRAVDHHLMQIWLAGYILI